MGDKRTPYTAQLTFRIGAEIKNAINLSGQTRADWMRKAAQMRIEQESFEDTPLGAVQRQLIESPKAR